MNTNPEGLRIIRLEANNILGLRAVEIEPSGAVVIVGGRNGQGKTSVLNAIMLALGGASASRSIPKQLRDGETEGDVTIDLGDITVTRTWRDGRSALKVESAVGGRISSPQKLLDDLIGRLSFDPLAFLQLRPTEQVAALLDLVDLPFDPDDLERERKAVYDERTFIGRTVRGLKSELDNLAPIPPETPETEVDVAGLVAEVQAMNEQVRKNEDARTETSALDHAVTVLEMELDGYRDELAELQAKIDRTETALSKAEDALFAANDATESLVDPDPAPLLAQIDTAETVNEKVRLRHHRDELRGRLAATETEYDGHTQRIDAIDRERADGLASVDMPIDGLGIDDGHLTYHGVPLSQASGAEQLKVAVAMAMAMNPTVRVIRVTDGSLLDTDNLAVIEEMAAEGGYQMWVERVGDGDATAVVIEDGMVLEDRQAVPA